ncbi:MAG: ABC transporter ATP-binding protein [Chloroflexi bacterium]|nr:ABC transporter ATP-binding protein [Chloroflexota bacterium]
MTATGIGPDAVVEVAGLTRRFGAVTAVDGLDLTVARGELFGLVGPDGAGKTTALRLLIGVLTPDEGTIRIAGQLVPAQLDAVRARLGYVPQRFSLYGDLTVMENLTLTASLYGVPAATARSRATDLLRLVDLTGARDRLAQQLSGGMRQKLALACALVHAPDLLVLDEPTNGVDPIARREFWRLLTGLRADGATVLVSTAYLDEAELCGRVGVLVDGRLLATATPAALRAAVDTPLVEVTVRPRQLAQALAQSLPSVVDARLLGSRLQVAFAPGTAVTLAMATLAGALVTGGVTTEALRPVAPTLEDAVIWLMAARETASP